MPIQQTMLIVDDESINRDILTQFFQDDFQILEAANGQEAQELIKNHSVDIVLLDLLMPVMDGMQLLAWIKSSPRYREIPVIVTTSKGDTHSEAQAMEIGADDFLTKPYNHTIVVCRVRNVIGRLENEQRKVTQQVQEQKIAVMQNILDVDQLTGLYTKKSFLQHTQELLKNNPDTRYCIVYLDIANFRLINELFNMETGDTILQTAGSYFLTIVGKHGLACHLAVDSFALCLPVDILDTELMMQGIDTLMRSLSIYRSITFYAGIYTVENIYIQPKQMLDRAHMAMKAAKANLTPRYAFYDEELQTTMLEEQQMAKEMETALANGQFYTMLRPIYTLDCKHSIAAEIVICWLHPQHGYIDPNKFIPIFEKNGFITYINHFAWDQACRFLSRQKDWGVKIRPVGVNISYVDVYDNGFVNHLTQLLRKYGLQPWMMWLKLTEKVYISAPKQQLSKILKRLKSYGFTILLDDFGSSISSLNLLSELNNIDILKIEMQHFDDPQIQKRANIVLHSLIDMAEKLDLKTIIKGLQNQEQVSEICQLGNPSIQGIYYHPPLTSDEYINLLSSTPSPLQH